jgi:2-C-methyl-D-erythritol 2,4-cyclodiphosphate synthase
MQNRVGFGYDVHQLKEDLPLIIGGVRIEFSKGIVAHSDGDILIHSICDALLGAAGLRDIGFCFPDTDDNFKNISSLLLLEKTLEMIRENGYKVVNIDSTICLQKPRIQGHIPEMREIISKTINTDVSNISVKATTTEYLGFIGTGDGIACYSIALIEKIQVN